MVGGELIRYFQIQADEETVPGEVQKLLDRTGHGKSSQGLAAKAILFGIRSLSWAGP